VLLSAEAGARRAARRFQPPSFSRDICVKVRDGKGAEYAAFLRDTTMKLAKVRLDAGMYSSFVIAQAVEPVGRSARCDYHIVYGFVGFPPENPSAEQTASDMKKAGIAMSGEQVAAKRGELSYLVGIHAASRIGQKPPTFPLT
jgi:hypothetical protein